MKPRNLRVLAFVLSLAFTGTAVANDLAIVCQDRQFDPYQPDSFKRTLYITNIAATIPEFSLRLQHVLREIKEGNPFRMSMYSDHIRHPSRALPVTFTQPGEISGLTLNPETTFYTVNIGAIAGAVGLPENFRQIPEGQRFSSQLVVTTPIVSVEQRQSNGAPVVQDSVRELVPMTCMVRGLKNDEMATNAVIRKLDGTPLKLSTFKPKRVKKKNLDLY